MYAKTLEALRGSIAKWEAIVAGVGIDEGTMNCPLCALFYSHHCRGCPVYQKAGDTDCRNTPYSVFSRTAPAGPINNITNIRLQEKLRANAQAELDFLRSLLPSDE